MDNEGPYDKYSFWMEVVKSAFSMLLSAGVVAFCMYMLTTIDGDNRMFNVYFGLMIFIVSVWIPVKSAGQSISKKLLDRLRGDTAPKSREMLPRMRNPPAIPDSAEYIPPPPSDEESEN